MLFLIQISLYVLKLFNFQENIHFQILKLVNEDLYEVNYKVSASN